LRQHLGEKGIGKLFALPIALHADKVKKAKEVMVDTHDRAREKHHLPHGC
jgi:hypothetical protein